jgi:hypothetical protein
MATGRPMSSMFQQNRFRFVYLGQFSTALSNKALNLVRKLASLFFPPV